MMNDEENKLHKSNSPERKLTLKKVYKESPDEDRISDDPDNECKKNTVCTFRSPCDDDSILDFKSPKKIHFMQPKNISSKRLLDKSKKKVSRAKIKIIKHEKGQERSKLPQNKKILHETQQTSIESSFFKTEKKVDALQNSTDMKTAYVCPLCFKSLKDEDSQAIHMKNCAIKNNVSTKKLLDAMELQERQAAERKSLGLLSAPMLQDKKKPVSRKIVSHDDSDLQLALALSKSLYEKEEMEICDEAEIMAISSSSLPDSNKECSRKTTLQIFGFTSSRNISPTHNYPNKMKRKGKLIEPTILQRRTSTERERILTERIAEILMSYKDFTQKLQEGKEQPNNIKQRIIVKSQLLQQLHQTENTLWDRTSLTSNQNIFYVKQLSPQITTLADRKQELNVHKEEQNIIEIMDQNVNSEKCLVDKKGMINEKMKEMQIVNIKNYDEELITMNSNKTCKTCYEEKRFLNTLATSWENILNDSSASDIIVLVKDSRHIWTHKLVFYVRCTNILLDVTCNDTEFTTAKEKICWIDIDYNSALAFLEFIYSGMIKKYSEILDSSTSLSTIRSLARKYKAHDLFAYLRHKEELKYNSAEVKCNYIFKESAEDTPANMEIALNTSELNSVTFNASMNHLHDGLENIQGTRLKENVNSSQSFEDSHVTMENFDSPQSKTAVLMRPLQHLNSKNNTPIDREINTSLDMFNDTLDIVRCNNKSLTCSKDQDDSNINILLNLIKQDQDIDICSQTLLTRNINAEYSKAKEDISICSQNIIQTDSNLHPNSSKSSIDKLHQNSLIGTIQRDNSEIIQDCLSNVQKQKNNLRLFIEKIQAANSDSELDSDLDLTIHRAQISPLRYLNPFHKKKQDNPDNKDLVSHSDNIKPSANPEEKIGRLSIVERHMQSYAKKNPEFYSCLSNKSLPEITQDNIWHTDATSSKKVIKLSHNQGTNNRIEDSTTSIEEDINTSKQTMNSPLTAMFPSHNKITNQSPNENICNSDTDEKDISMYSEYMKNHKNNSIAKYRAAIKKNTSDSNLSDQSVSFDSSHEDNNTDEDNEILTQSILTQKDADIIVSSDTEISSISSNTNCSIIFQNDDSDHVSNSMQSGRTRRITECNKPDTENEKNKQLLQTEQISKTITTDVEAKQDIINNHTINKSNGYQLDISDTEIASNDTDLCMNLSQSKFRLDKGDVDKTDCHKKEFTPSPIMISSSPDFLHSENSLPNMKYGSEDIIKIDSHDSRRPAKCNFNFEDNIYLANVDIDQYEKQYDSEKNQSINTTAPKKCNSRNNKSDKKNIVDNNTITDDNALGRGNLDRNAVSFIHNSTNVRKFKKKSLSEGQISINTLHNQRAMSSKVSMQIQSNYNQNIRNIATDLKIIDRDITPPPNYDSMATPELHKEMKRYGLKAQKRSRAVKLLSHIYNELHPLVPVEQTIAEVSSDNESPPRKKQNMNGNNLNKSNNTEDSDGELSYSQDSNESMNFLKNTINVETEFYETEQLSAELELKNLSNIGEAFTKLISIDKDLHNKILRYEPVNIEKLHSTLRAHGFKCRFSNLICFLDEQCITFYTAEQNVRNETRRKVNTE